MLTSDKHSSLLGSLVSYKVNEVLWNTTTQGPIRNTHFLCNSWMSPKRKSYIRKDMLNSDKHSSLLGSFVSYKETEALWNTAARGCIRNTYFLCNSWMCPISKSFTRKEMLVSDKHSSLLGSFVSYKKMKCHEYSNPGAVFTTLIFFVTHEWAQ